MSKEFSLRPIAPRADSVKLLLNIGATLDIPTGDFTYGRHGEAILLGGLGITTGVVGGPNSFKSTLAHYMKLSAMDRLLYVSQDGSVMETSANDNDTEVNMHEGLLRRFTTKFDHLKDRNLFAEGIWSITDKTVQSGNEWYVGLKEYANEKVKHASKITYETPMLDRDGKTLYTTILPTFTSIDSFSEFETDDITDIRDRSEIGQSEQNVISARQGLVKSMMISELPRVTGRSNHFMILTAHLNEAINIGGGPYAPVPKKQLGYLRQNERIKGVTGKFTFLMSNCWATISASPMLTKDRTPEYPKDSSETNQRTTDLNKVVIQQLRGKSGPSGFNLEILVSQREGVLVGLTEFENIKTNGRFGLVGNLQNYALAIYPECRISRTTVRGKLDSDPKLRRAMNITSEISQIEQFKWDLRDYIMEPAKLYETIKELGYCWDMILERTRGWWCFNNDKQPLLFLSSLDILRMARGEYHPYWLEDDKKTIKKEYDIAR